MKRKVEAEYEEKYGKKITRYLVNIAKVRLITGDYKYLGDAPDSLIAGLLAANDYLLNRCNELEK